MKEFLRFVRCPFVKIVFVVAIFSASSLHATTVAEEGLGIIKEAISRDSGFGDSVSEVKMVLKNAEGQESYRSLKISTLEVEGDGDKLLTYFDRPRDIKGTALLALTHLDRDDDQWLFLPAIRRVKRIQSSNKSGSFLGSEFAYEDLASEEVEKFTSYTYLRDEPCGKLSCFVVERVPANKNSGYTRQLVWIDSEHYRFMRIDYYDRRNTLLKTRTYSDYQLYLGKFWRSSDITMENHQSGKTTKLLVGNVRFQVGLSNRDFDRNSLKRAR